MESTVSSRVLKRAEKELRQTKVIIRHLPPDQTKEKLLTILDPLPSCKYFIFVPGDPVLGKFGCSRAYINFDCFEDIVPFRDAYDGMILETERGVKYRIIIELAPYQVVPRGRPRPDHRCGTIFGDTEYQEFLETYEKQINPLPSIDVTYLHEVEKMKVESLQTTPLTSYLKERYSTPRGEHRGNNKKNKILYATGSKKKKDKIKEIPKGRVGGKRDRRDTKEPYVKEPSSRSRGGTETTKVIVIDKSSQLVNGGINGNISSTKSTTVKVTKATDSPTPGQHRGGKNGGHRQQSDQQFYVAGNKKEKTEQQTGTTTKKDTKRDEGETRRKGRTNNRGTYGGGGGRYRRGQYNDRHDNHYEFKDDEDSYQGPDYGVKGASSGTKGSSRTRYNDYGSDDRRGRYYGRSRDHYDNESKGGSERVHK